MPSLSEHPTVQRFRERAESRNVQNGSATLDTQWLRTLLSKNNGTFRGFWRHLICESDSGSSPSDPWDLTVELVGVVLGAWLVHTLSYPLFSKVPHFPPEPDMPGLDDLGAKFGIDIVSAIVTGFYIFIVDPFELRPLTILERQTLSFEVALVFIAFRAGLKRGLNPSSDSINLCQLLRT